MFPKEMHERHLAELGAIKRYMDDIDTEAAVLKKSEGFPLHSLIIDVEGDYRERKRTVSLNFLPLADEDFEFIHLLQFYSVLLFDYEEQYRYDLQELLFNLNRITTIGDFGFKGESEIDFRYVYTLPLAEVVSQGEVSETLFLFVFMLDIYAEWIEAVGTGERALADVLNEINNM